MLTVVRQKAEVRERTPTTRRILSRSDLQAAIASLSSFIWNRENFLLLPRLTTCLWISSMELRLRSW